VSFWESLDLLRESVLCILIASALCAYLGVFVLLQRVVFVSAAISQSSGVGIALAFFVGSFARRHGESAPAWATPQLWAIAGALLCALFFSRKPGGGRVASETVVGLVWVIASAGLLLVLSSPRVVQEVHEVDSLLYGTSVVVSAGQTTVLGVVAAVLLALHVFLYKEFLLISYDREMADALGYRTHLWNALLYATLGVGISFAVRTIGALPTFALLVIPGTAAKLLVRRVGWVFPLAVGIAMAASLAGFYASFVADLPTGPALVTVTALFLLPGAAKQLLARA
jgi:zinc transport system permease protein